MNLDGGLRRACGDSQSTVRGLAPCVLYAASDRRAFLVVLFLIGTSNYIDRNVLSVLLESIKHEFSLSDTMLGALSGLSFGVFYATLGIPMARWADNGDRKLVLTVSLSLWSVMTAMCGLASNFWQLAAARFGVGVGEAGAIPPAQSLIADYFPREERGRALGILMTSGPIGYAVALALGGFIAQNYGWRAAFVIVSLCGALLAPVAHSVLQEPRRAMTFRGRTQHESLLTAFATLAHKRAYLNVLAGIVLYFLMSYGALVFIVSHMMRFHRLSVGQAGLTYGAIAGLGAVIGGIGGGVVADRLAMRDVAWHPRLASVGMIGAVLAYELTLGARSTTTMFLLLFVATILVSGVIPPMYSALHAVCGSTRRATAVAIAFFFANLIGFGLGPVIAGALSDLLARTYGAARGLQYALMIVMSVLVAGAWFMWRAAWCFHSDIEE